jgi:3-deoxy-D-manno-octulosonate 8-phosphate phosphatase (KDO 8-P phosphatase)
MSISIDKIDAIILDCDGVLTNNLVYLDQNGKETVSFSRSDGLAFDALRKLGKLTYILSTELNPVVSARAQKLKITALQGVTNKVNTLKELAFKDKFDLQNTLYVGNDLNDYHAMKLCGFALCPSDAHQDIKDISSIILKKKGGEGVVREVLEDIFEIDILQILF